MIRLVLILSIAFFTSLSAAASCMMEGKAEQSVSLSVEGKSVERWVPTGEIHRVKLSNGFEAGILIEPATAEKYREIMNKPGIKGIDELVKIRIYDAGANPPKELSMTWGGANSKQGFGPRGGANGINEMGVQIELWLHKPVCVTSANAEEVAKSAKMAFDSTK